MSVKDIPEYIPPSQPSAKPKNPTKNQKYRVRMSAIPQGMVCTFGIMSTLIKMKYDDRDLLVLEDVMSEPYASMVAIRGGPIACIAQDWASGMDRARLLGLINMSHFWVVK